MANDENIVYIVRDKRVITSLSVTFKMPTFFYFIVYQGKQKTNKNKFLILIKSQLIIND